MADNYIEKREQELGLGHAGGLGAVSSPFSSLSRKPSLDELIARNRSHRAYDRTYKVHRLQLEAIVAVNTRLASGRNAQTLRFRIVTPDDEHSAEIGRIKIGGFLPELGLPVPGTEPSAFVVACSTVEENSTVDIDLGISLQTMGLKAVELGLNALIIRAFDRKWLKELLCLEYEPLAILAVGKGCDNIVLEATSGKDLKYYRDAEGRHHVPKLSLEEIMIK